MAGQNKNLVWLVVAVAAIIMFGGGGQQSTTPDGGTSGAGSSGNTGGTTTGQCAYAPTYSLSASDKWDNTVVISGAHRVIQDGEVPKTYSGTATETNLGEKIKVMWGNGNATIYNVIQEYTISKCGLTPIVYKELVRNTSLTMQCFNEENNLIDDAGENETVGAGDSVSLKCQILGVSERGMPHGGVIVAELNGSSYVGVDTQLTSITPELITGSKMSAPSFHTVTSTANKASAWNVAPILGAGTREFTLTFKAESIENPNGFAGGGSDITLVLYSKDAFENSETNDFQVGVEDQDGLIVGDEIARETVQVD